MFVCLCLCVVHTRSSQRELSPNPVNRTGWDHQKFHRADLVFFFFLLFFLWFSFFGRCLLYNLCTTKNASEGLVQLHHQIIVVIQHGSICTSTRSGGNADRYGVGSSEVVFIIIR